MFDDDIDMDDDDQHSGHVSQRTRHPLQKYQYTVKYRPLREGVMTLDQSAVDIAHDRVASTLDEMRMTLRDEFPRRFRHDVVFNELDGRQAYFHALRIILQADKYPGSSKARSRD